ncbi:MAG TPA: hypothetical protein PLF13_01635 [candidate division Zixibacteria bacterium]|nr:hypothetical protein [candidate division Zixibacteria bacterium]
MQKLIQKAVETGKATTVLVALISLVISGLIVVDQVSVTIDNKAKAVDEPVVVIVDDPSADLVRLEESDQPADPKDASENMTPSGKPNCRPVAFLVSAEFSKPNNSNDRTPLDERNEDVVLIETTTRSTGTTACASCAQVKPSLGRQFTLVGARPSGTS